MFEASRFSQQIQNSKCIMFDIDECPYAIAVFRMQNIIVYTIYCIQLYIVFYGVLILRLRSSKLWIFCEILYNNHNARRSHETVIFSCRSSFSGLQTHKTGENSYYVYENRLYDSFSVYETSRAIGKFINWPFNLI